MTDWFPFPPWLSVCDRSDSALCNECSWPHPDPGCTERRKVQGALRQVAETALRTSNCKWGGKFSLRHAAWRAMNKGPWAWGRCALCSGLWRWVMVENRERGGVEEKDLALFQTQAPGWGGAEADLWGACCAHESSKRGDETAARRVLEPQKGLRGQGGWWVSKLDGLKLYGRGQRKPQKYTDTPRCLVLLWEEREVVIIPVHVQRQWEHRRCPGNYVRGSGWVFSREMVSANQGVVPTKQDECSHPTTMYSVANLCQALCWRCPGR